MVSLNTESWSSTHTAAVANLRYHACYLLRLFAKGDQPVAPTAESAAPSAGKRPPIHHVTQRIASTLVKIDGESTTKSASWELL